jgi:hypothetical protein
MADSTAVMAKGARDDMISEHLCKPPVLALLGHF